MASTSWQADKDADDQETDSSLMEGIKRGDRKSLEILIERYWGLLTRYAGGIVGRADDAEDVVQETFVRVWRSRSEWNPTGTVASYLYRITRNLALNALRDQEALTRREQRSGEEQPGIRSVSPLDHVEHESLRIEVEAAIAALPERRREVFVLSRFHGLSHQEIAQTMGISIPTVANQMTSALAQLRKALSHHLSKQ